MVSRSTIILILSITATAVFSRPDLAPLDAYDDYRWQPAGTDVPAPQPALAPGETIPPLEGIAAVADQVMVPVRRGDGTTRLLVWSTRTGEARSRDWGTAGVFGLASLPGRKQFIVRDRQSLVFLNARDLTEESRSPFPAARGWRAIAADDTALYEIAEQRDAVNIFSLPDLKPVTTIAVPAGKLQRLIPIGANRLLLWSSYWPHGSPRVLDTVTGELRESLVLGMHHHALFKTAWRGHGAEFIALPAAKSDFHGTLLRVGNSIIPLGAGSERDKSGIGYRFSPVRQRIQAVLRELPPAAGDARFHLLLPAKSLYTQELANEEYRGTIVTDPFGNRFLTVPLSSLGTDDRGGIVLYRADITRYKAAFDLPRAGGAPGTPPALQRYLADNAILVLDDPLVRETHRSIMAGAATYREQIIAAHAFAMTIKGVWDGKNETVPNVIRNMHGGCNEHTRVIVAMLRLSGVAARYAWNHLSRGYEEKTFELDHAIAEAWVNGTGWIPLEGLGRTYAAVDPYIVFEVGAPECRAYQPGTAKGPRSLQSLNAKVTWSLLPPR